MKSLEGKVALVTGAGKPEQQSGGIGFGCALTLAHSGVNVLLNDANQEVLESAYRWIKPQQFCGTFSGDIFEQDQRRGIADVAETWMQGVSILVTGPATTIRKPALELTSDDYASVYYDNFVSHVDLAKLVAAGMVRRGSDGCIIFITSIYGSLVRKGSLPYDAAKAALNQATKVLAKEWAPFGIRVNAIEPGFVDTPGEHKFATDVEIETVKRKLPLGAATSEDIGKVAVMLASSEHITGQIIRVDGGHGLVDLYDQV
ncbi:SDR family oxidoreductase [Candidatus Kaiserbacteria bacterium]|nr:SDR family oxidoreductase [Candidatus Kaiserbacteria bacterium]